MKKVILLLISIVTVFAVNLFAAKNLYLSILKEPTSVHKNQKFEVKVKALVTTTDFTSLTTNFSNQSNITVMNPSSPWKKISDDTYENSFYFKVKSSNFKLPIIEVKLWNSNSLIDISTIETGNIGFSNIGKNDDRFSKVIADNIILKAYKTKQYNNQEALTIIDIDAVNSNLEDFNLDNVVEQGVSSIKEWENIQNLVYYVVTPIYDKNLTFTYFNSLSNSFKEVRVPLILQNELVSTQTDLNPNDSTFEKYKKVASTIVFIFLLILFIWKRKKYLIPFVVITFIFALIYNLPNDKGKIQTDSFVYILPTKNSTVFFKADKELEVEVLEKKGQFIKVLGVEDGFIGWIKEDSFEKN
ncbi:hypothetical protein [Aliarcobacter cibarius]|jgi:hypothetical protein|uniref:SH3 domain-containing protein n=1 Tax=Aliarcobacter cibarius TaxID=255507 RepID=A0ABY2V7U6_9BACT|nr:hypothetical protein [Aliarcobacter cibarius]QEZ88385.1 putative membrane protein [Aliarcobacter cibarius]TLT01883.1 hypothetical protein FE247_00505 [Aliarcobacter cibarius]TLT02218.1 hypothetical protein FE245_00505 [Aliarcobacter cibarius]TLT04649.1 hypothetical protein FE248_03200 [Aliarcobacter cibarius]